MISRLGKILVMSLASTLLTTDANSDSNGDAVKMKIGDVFHRTMKHWKYSYTALDTTKAGVACMRWQHIEQKFLDDGIFEAIGFSYSVAKEEAAIRIAASSFATEYENPIALKIPSSRNFRSMCCQRMHATPAFVVSKLV